jgi:hypothetical protein
MNSLGLWSVCLAGPVLAPGFHVAEIYTAILPSEIKAREVRIAIH